MKKIIFLLVLFFVSGCVGFAVTTNSFTEKTTRTVRSIEQIKNDDILAKKIKKHIKKDIKMFAEINNMKKIGKYKITVFDGRVLITGIVADVRVKNFIYNKVWDFNGEVKEVINELEIAIKDESNALVDYFISKSIKNRLIFTNGIRSVNYSVKVVDRNAYVLGIAYDDEEIRKVGYVTSTTKGVQKAVIHVITKDDLRR